MLLNQFCLEQKKTYTIASVERAICDRIYLLIYNNKRVVLEVKKLIKKYAK